MNCCLCGTVKNCAPYLERVFSNMEQIGALFNDYKILIYYDVSTDNTLQILKNYQNKNPKMMFYENKRPVSQFRTHNLAIARNYCLNFVRNNINTFPYFIMMDMDDVNCKYLNIGVLKKSLERNDWDGLSFNTNPKYYDVWALSIYPYYFSYVHFNHSHFYNHFTVENYIDSILKKTPKDKLLKCISSFNGFAIYRTNKFLNTYYDGRVRKELFPKKYIEINKKISKSNIIYKKCDNINGRFEDCEHRAFHIQAIKNSGARIRISPEVLFI
jgi:hypothetical protein